MTPAAPHVTFRFGLGGVAALTIMTFLPSLLGFLSRTLDLFPAALWMTPLIAFLAFLYS